MYQLILILVLSTQAFKCGAASLSASDYDKMPPLFSLDLYDKCMRQNGTYCLVQLNLYADENNHVMKLIQDHSSHTTIHYNYTYLMRGVCVTKTCRKYLYGAKDIDAGVEMCMNESILQEFGVKAKTHILYCDKHDKPIAADVVDWMVAAMFAFVLIANIFGTFYDVLCRNVIKRIKVTENPWLISFSIIRNTKSLVKPANNSKTECLQGFYGIRSIISFWVIAPHVMIIFAAGFTDNPQDYEKGFENGTYQFFINGNMLVLTFFVMSGFLLVHNFQVLSEMTPITWKLLPKIMITRWLRLTPAYAMMIAFSATWLRHMGSGPLWNLFISGSVADCRKYWWMHFLYIQNYELHDKYCALQTWHLAADTQLYLVGVIVHIATQTRGRWVTLAILLLVGMVAPALHVWLQDLDAISLIGPEQSRTSSIDTFYKMQIRGHNNLAGFIMGMTTSYAVYHWQKNKTDFSKYKVLRYLCWAIIPSILGMFLTGSIFYPEEGRASLKLRLLYAATYRVIFSGIISFTIITMVMKCEDKFRALFEWSGWQVPGKLSYSVFLLHMIFVQIIMGTTHQLRHVSYFHMAILHLGVASMTFLVAIPYYVMVEAPFYRLAKVYFEKNQQVTKKIM